jgi:PPOX class probable FMN-dependent enzyme
MTDPANQLSDSNELRAHYGDASERVKAKKGSVLAGETIQAIEMAPFFCLSTSDSQGRCDASPRGGPSGFIKVLDEHTLAFPDLSGNRLIDSLSNIVENPNIGMLIMTPGHDETIRVDGTAQISTAPDAIAIWDDILGGVKATIVVNIDNVFIHCAKAFRRSRLWQPDTWDAYKQAPDATVVFNSIADTGVDPADMREFLEADYEETLASEVPS